MVSGGGYPNTSYLRQSSELHTTTINWVGHSVCLCLCLCLTFTLYTHHDRRHQHPISRLLSKFLALTAELRRVRGPRSELDPNHHLPEPSLRLREALNNILVAFYTFRGPIVSAKYLEGSCSKEPFWPFPPRDPSRCPSLLTINHTLDRLSASFSGSQAVSLLAFLIEAIDRTTVHDDWS